MTVAKMRYFLDLIILPVVVLFGIVIKPLLENISAVVELITNCILFVCAVAGALKLIKSLNEKTPD